MTSGLKGGALRVLTWVAVVLAVMAPIVLASASPLLEWRRPVYIAAGFAGIVGMTIILVQPLLAAGFLPGLETPRGRRVHRWTGTLLVGAVLLHVVGLWITSPPDLIDALLFRSPTPFAPWGVIAMWAIFAAALVAALRRPLRLRYRTWRVAHTSLVVIVVIGTVVHALLIEGTMETVSKVLLSALVLLATAAALAHLWRTRRGVP